MVHTKGTPDSRYKGQRKNIYDVLIYDKEGSFGKKNKWRQVYDLRTSTKKEAEKIAKEEYDKKGIKVKVKKANEKYYDESDHYDD